MTHASVPDGRTGYGPVRSVTRSSQALRRDPNVLNMGRPRRAPAEENGSLQQGASTLVCEDALVAELNKSRKAEVSEKSLAGREDEQLTKAKTGEWDKMLGSHAVRVHCGREARS